MANIVSEKSEIHVTNKAAGSTGRTIEIVKRQELNICNVRRHM